MSHDFTLVDPQVPWTDEEWTRASRYSFNVWWSPEDQHFLARCVEVPAAISHGRTNAEAVHNATDAVASYIDAFDEAPDPIGGQPTQITWTTTDVAGMLGVSVRRVQALAKHRGVGQRIGRTLLFTADDIAAMKPGPVGHPKTE